MFERRRASAAGRRLPVEHTDRILSRAGVRARRERSPTIFCGGTRAAALARDLLLRETCVYLLLFSAVRGSCDANKWTGRHSPQCGECQCAVPLPLPECWSSGSTQPLRHDARAKAVYG